MLRTAGPAVTVELAPDRRQVGSSFDDMTYVRARVVDANGVRVPRSDHLLRFAVEGGGELIATDNASSTDHNPFHSAERRAEDGQAVALVRGAGSGPFRVTATAEGLRPASVELRAEP